MLSHLSYTMNQEPVFRFLARVQAQRVSVSAMRERERERQGELECRKRVCIGDTHTLMCVQLFTA